MATVCAFAIIALAVLLWDTNERARRAIAALDAVDLRLAAAMRRVLQRQAILEMRLSESTAVRPAVKPPADVAAPAPEGVPDAA